MGASDEHVFVGGYTADKGGDGEGIVRLRRDPATGELTGPAVVTRTPSPSFLTQHPALPVLYAVNELDPGGTVSAFTVDATGDLTPLASRPTGGSDPAHLAVTADGRHLLVANYGTGSVAVFPLDADGAPGERTDLLTLTGSGPVADRQAGPHAHMVFPVRDEVLIADLGSDKVWRARLDPVSGRLTLHGAAVSAQPGTGPRHVRFSPDGALFVVGELSGDLTWWSPGAEGSLDLAGQAASTTAEGENYPSEIVVRPEGRFVYVANRGANTVATFAWDGEAATLVAETPAGGDWPRHMILVGDHLYVTNQRSQSVTIFRIDPETGVPAAPGDSVSAASPTCVLRWNAVGGR
ncbi:lactonase family protein [Paractinoplanes lichenicola]|uniref:Lactonase family protein n=1 Tax=Paractinoplanes lichenicola TaxID=2802976 RepID=A0ABS1W134_9ACTN|nr:lactonase family protein [Actinoplanes lichenicola]MBL7260425.1 lactonase family protein [Actinoplanes lichenicola]